MALQMTRAQSSSSFAAHVRTDARQTHPGASKRLHSWKEIARFLDCDERTVKRWEQTRDLPIHRIPGGNRSKVYACADELRRWLDGGRPLRASAAEPAAVRPLPPTKAAGRQRRETS